MVKIVHMLKNQEDKLERIQMRGYNLIAVFNREEDKVVMCKRKKNPYKGSANFVGGKIEKNENGIEAAYRELQEETTITRDR